MTTNVGTRPTIVGSIAMSQAGVNARNRAADRANWSGVKSGTGIPTAVAKPAESLQIGEGRVAPALEERCESGHVRVGLGPLPRSADERRLAQDEARDDVRPLGGGEHGRHTAVGVGDEVAAGRQRVDDDRLDVVGMVTIVDPADEVRLVAEGRRLQGPGLGTRRSSPVEEDDGHGPSMPCAPGSGIPGARAGGVSVGRRTLLTMRPTTDLQRRAAPFEVISDFEPSGDQPDAIKPSWPGGSGPGSPTPSSSG